MCGCVGRHTSASFYLSLLRVPRWAQQRVCGQDIYNSSYANIPQDPEHTAYCLAHVCRTDFTSLQVSSDHVDC